MIGVPFVLLGLALTDAGFAGYRDAAGRDGRIFKDELYRRAVRRGLGAGARIALIVTIWLAGLIGSAPDVAQAWRDQIVAFEPLLAVTAIYAVTVLAALGVWAVGESDVRSLSSVMVLGPFTLIRPFVMLASGVAAVALAPTVRSALGVALPCLLQLWVGWWLGRAWRNGARPVQ